MIVTSGPVQKELGTIYAVFTRYIGDRCAIYPTFWRGAHRAIFPKSYWIKPKSDCSYHFFDWLWTKQTVVCFQMNRHMINTIWFRFDSRRFRNKLSVYTVACGHGRKRACPISARCVTSSLLSSDWWRFFPAQSCTWSLLAAERDAAFK